MGGRAAWSESKEVGGERPVPYTHGLGLESSSYTHAILGCLGAILSGSPVLLKYLCIYDNSKNRFSNVSLIWDLSYKIQVQLHQLLDTELTYAAFLQNYLVKIKAWGASVQKLCTTIIKSDSRYYHHVCTTNTMYQRHILVNLHQNVSLSLFVYHVKDGSL